MPYCDWGSNKDIKDYHDNIWGRPVHDDRLHFEHLSFEVMQCGLSWSIVYGKREILRQCFDNFDFDKVARYDDADVERILHTEGMIRAVRKIKAVTNNAKHFAEIREKYGSFDAYLWQFTDGKTILYDKHSEGYIPASNGLSEMISKDLKQKGFTFLGPVVMYSHMQSAGLINDHDKNCPCFDEINAQWPVIRKRRLKEKNISFYR